MISKELAELVSAVEDLGFQPKINLDRPIYVQPEDSLEYRGARIILICGKLNRSNGLSKELVACIDFLLRNPGYQRKFILEYFKGQKNLSSKLHKFLPDRVSETDFHIIQYKSVPWDIRFNDMFLFLYIRDLVFFDGEKPNIKVKLTDIGEEYFSKLLEIFINEANFLDVFGKVIYEDRTKKIITDVIPSSYWKDNEKLNYK